MLREMANRKLEKQKHKLTVPRVLTMYLLSNLHTCHLILFSQPCKWYMVKYGYNPHFTDPKTDVEGMY